MKRKLTAIIAAALMGICVAGFAFGTEKEAPADEKAAVEATTEEAPAAEAAAEAEKAPAPKMDMLMGC